MALAVAIGLTGCHRSALAPSQTVDQTLLTALRNRQFAQLDQILEADQRAFEQNPLAEETVETDFDAFVRCDQKEAALLKHWTSVEPDSYPAHLARASYLFRQGWIARGLRIADETSDQQFVSMARLFSEGAQEAMAALKLNPRLSVGYRLVILAERSTVKLDAIQALAEAGLKQTPASFAIREGFMLALLPRWGGSDAAMEQFAAQSQAFAKNNPRLHLLLGFADWDRGDEITGQDQQAALTYYNQALREGGDYWRFLLSRGKVYYWLKRYDDAEHDLRRARQLSPNDREIYEYLAWVGWATKNPNEVSLEVRAYRELAPPTPQLLQLDRWALEFEQERASRAAAGMPAGHSRSD